MVNDGMTGVLLENRRFDLAAEVAIDAGIIDEEVAGHVLGIGALGIGHTDKLYAYVFLAVSGSLRCSISSRIS